MESLDISEEHMYCKALYEEYKKLEVVTHIETQILKRGQSYKVQYINYQDLMHRKILAKELAEHCKDYFKDKPGEWYEIEMDAKS